MCFSFRRFRPYRRGRRSQMAHSLWTGSLVEESRKKETCCRCNVILLRWNETSIADLLQQLIRRYLFIFKDGANKFFLPKTHYNFLPCHKITNGCLLVKIKSITARNFDRGHESWQKLNASKAEELNRLLDIFIYWIVQFHHCDSEMIYLRLHLPSNSSYYIQWWI